MINPLQLSFGFYGNPTSVRIKILDYFNIDDAVSFGAVTNADNNRSTSISYDDGDTYEIVYYLNNSSGYWISNNSDTIYFTVVIRGKTLEGTVTLNRLVDNAKISAMNFYINCYYPFDRVIRIPLTAHVSSGGKPILFYKNGPYNPNYFKNIQFNPEIPSEIMLEVINQGIPETSFSHSFEYYVAYDKTGLPVSEESDFIAMGKLTVHFYNNA